MIGICWMVAPGLAQAAGPPLFRVALEQGVPLVSFQVSRGNYSLIDEATGLPVGAPREGEVWTVTPSGTSLLVEAPGLPRPLLFRGPLLLKEKGGDELNLFQYKGVQYRGNLVVQNLDCSLLAVNLLDLEKYLYGVVGKEMGGNSLEALSAQAVVSRSYALSQRGLNTWFDSYADTRSQAYGGYTAELAYGREAVAAVDRTRGEVLKYQGNLVRAVFHSNAGGYTEDSENVWVESLPYLRAVPSEADAYAQSVGGWAAGTYRWTQSISRAELEKRLGIGEIRDIRLSHERTRVSRDPVSGRLRQEFIPGSRTASGRVTGVTVVGSRGTKSFYRDNIRAPFGLKSTLFDLNFKGQLQVLNAGGETVPLDSGEVMVLTGGGRMQSLPHKGGETWVIGAGGRMAPQSEAFNELTFTGRGYGHGLGLSQWGARGLAAQGYNYRAILEIYYNQGKHNGALKISENYGN